MGRRFDSWRRGITDTRTPSIYLASSFGAMIVTTDLLAIDSWTIPGTGSPLRSAAEVFRVGSCAISTRPLIRTTIRQFQRALDQRGGVNSRVD